MQVLTLMPLRTDPPRKEKTEIAAWCLVSCRPATVLADVAAVDSLGFREVGVFAVAAGPFVVPDVEDGAGLGRGFGFEG